MSTLEPVKAVISDGGLPIGTIVAYYGEISKEVPSSLPDGWLLCNNDKIPDGLEFEQLRILCNNAGHGGKVPDLRGMFLRGSIVEPLKEPLKNSDPDFNKRTGGSLKQKIGSSQEDRYERHGHTLQLSKKASVGDAKTTEVAWAGNSGSQTYLTLTPDDYEQYRGGVERSGASVETRPKNIYINYIIKAK